MHAHLMRANQFMQRGHDGTVEQGVVALAGNVYQAFEERFHIQDICPADVVARTRYDQP
jgi:hypothetical protein